MFSEICITHHSYLVSCAFFKFREFLFTSKIRALRCKTIGVVSWNIQLTNAAVEICSARLRGHRQQETERHLYGTNLVPP